MTVLLFHRPTCYVCLPSVENFIKRRTFLTSAFLAAAVAVAAVAMNVVRLFPVAAAAAVAARTPSKADYDHNLTEALNETLYAEFNNDYGEHSSSFSSLSSSSPNPIESYFGRKERPRNIYCSYKPIPNAFLSLPEDLLNRWMIKGVMADLNHMNIPVYRVVCDRSHNITSLADIVPDVVRPYVTAVTALHQSRLLRIGRYDLWGFLSLANLTVSYSGLSSVEDLAFTALTHLHTLILTHNLLHDLSWRTLGYNSAAWSPKFYIDVTGNPLETTCRNAWLFNRSRIAPQRLGRRQDGKEGGSQEKEEEDKKEVENEDCDKARNVIQPCGKCDETCKAGPTRSSCLIQLCCQSVDSSVIRS